MAKEIILYNLAPNVTEEEYLEYAIKEKAPLLESLPSVNKYTLIKITGSPAGEVTHRYMGIVDITSVESFTSNDAKTQKYLEFRKKFSEMATDVQIMFGEEKTA